MTTNLLPHQQEGLRVPVTDVRNRYITYNGNTVHDIEKAIKYLRNNLVGFFVAAPLNWGEGVQIDGDISKHLTVDLADSGQPAEYSNPTA